MSRKKNIESYGRFNVTRPCNTEDKHDEGRFISDKRKKERKQKRDPPAKRKKKFATVNRATDDCALRA